MKAKQLQRWVISLLVCLLTVVTSMSVFADTATTGGTQSGNTSAPSTGDGTTDVLAGVTVDYMFPLRYVVTNTSGQPITNASIEHFDASVNDYIFVGKTNEKGLWQTEMTPDFWMKGVLTKMDPAGVVYYENTVFNIQHRVSAEGYITKKEVASAELEVIDGQTVGVVYVVLEREAPEQITQTQMPSLLPKTGIQSYWMPLAAGSLLLLLAALIVAKMLYEERSENKDRRNTNS